MPRVRAYERIGDFLACAAARIDEPRGLQALERVLVEGHAPALPDGRLVGHHAEAGEGIEDIFRRAGNGARAVDVLDAHEPRAAMRAGVEPACQRADQRAEVQRACRRRRETAAIGCFGNGRHARVWRAAAAPPMRNGFMRVTMTRCERRDYAACAAPTCRCASGWQDAQVLPGT